MNRLLQDPRFVEGKEKILEALREVKKEVCTTGIKPAEGALKEEYETLLAQMAALRGAPLFHPYIGSGIGSELFVELLDGSVKYDLISGIGVHYFGHSHEGIVSSMIDAAVQNTVMQGNLQQNGDSLVLMEHLTRLSGFDHVFLTTSGAMACENAMKIIFQKKSPAFRVLAFEGCFMGRTLAMAQITDKPSFREGLPSTISCDYIPFFDPKEPQKSTERAVGVLKKQLAQHPGEYAALCLELVQGERGFYVGEREFFRTLICAAKEANLAILVDEVQTFARTYSPFAFQHFGLEDLVDVATLAKPLTLGATLWRKEMNPRPNLLSQTFTASTASIRAASYMLDYVARGELFGRGGKIWHLFSAFEKRLVMLEEKGLVKGPFGIGAMVAFTPLDGSKDVANKVVRRLFDNGIIAFLAGQDPYRIRFLLPVGAMEPYDVDSIMDIVEATLEKR